MRHTRTTTPRPTVRHRKIGRKVLRADHLNRVLSANGKRNKFTWLSRLPTMRPKTLALTCAAIIVASAVTFGGLQIYLGQVAASEKAAAAVRQDKLEAKSIAVEACRRQKLKEKADQIGTITYDELYDYGECDK